MSFTAYFSYQANLRPAWKTYYISYPELKNALHHIREELTQMKQEQKEHRKRRLQQQQEEERKTSENSALLSYQQQAVTSGDSNNNNNTTIVSSSSSSLLPANSSGALNPIENFGLSLRRVYSEQDSSIQENDGEKIGGTIVDDYFFRLEIGESLNMHIENFKNMFKKDVETVFKKYNFELKKVNEITLRTQKELSEARMKPFFNSETGPVLKEKFVEIYRELEFLYSFLHANRIASNNLLTKFEFCGEHSRDLKHWYEDLPNADFSTNQLKQSMENSQLLNALKYVAALSVILFNTLHVNLEDNDAWGPFRYIWIILTPVSTAYAFTWDILMDWGLFKFKQVKEEERAKTKLEAIKKFFTSQTIMGYKFVMRSRRIYGRRKLVYRLAIAFNLIARFAWAGTISTYFKQNKEFLAILFGSVELMRRCSWSVFRLEWAAISNDEGWRKHGIGDLASIYLGINTSK
ncbi:predicted protein [Naegleria gruberi]|uniref:Predicted protein n=1 Tax=Naegleria gruberi TaxID=5762 RepID=D2VME6_NAEGR|nr:uncharacterized protein NAEGRDRAFT_70106 [Naegleria gruberi]EFC41976.1 predicted protein [Naegleria gruberi]|eukprot:XP_002674720.1 predicted protein [Naegleria gruberi strain NEG-M]